MGAYPNTRPVEEVVRAGPTEDGPLSFSIPTDQGAMRLRFFAPPDHLRSYFGSVYSFRYDGAPYSDVTRADVAQFRLLLSGSGRYQLPDGSVRAASDAALMGPTNGATRFELDGSAHIFGVSLLPAGWARLGCGPAGALADDVRDVSGAGFDPGCTLREDMRRLAEPQMMADRLWTAMAAWVDRSQPLRDNVSHLMTLIDSWLAADGPLRIDKLVAATGLSARQLARHTNLYYGAPPKLLARKYRALRCSARIVLDGASWQTLCEEGGFYDQSHFIREIRHFIGLTPQQLQMEPTAAAQLTLLRRSLGSDVAMLDHLG